MKITARLLMLIAAILLAVSYLSGLFDPAKFWWLTIFGILFLPLLALNVILLLWAFFRRSSAFWIPLVALLVVFPAYGGYFQFPEGEKHAENQEFPEGEKTSENKGLDTTVTKLKILTYNVGKFNLYPSGKALSRKSDRDSILNLIASLSPDVICIQEFHTSGSDEFKTFLEKEFSDYESVYYLYPTNKGSYGNVILSRLPVKDKLAMDFEKSSNLALYADIIVNNSILRVYNCHLQSYNLSLPGMVKALRTDYEATFKSAEDKLRSSIILRPRQVDMVLDDIEACENATIVTGDFNDTPLSYAVRRLGKGHQDTFRQVGEGFGATMSLLWPLLRIDYILVPDDCKVLTHSVLRKNFSDHYPVFSEIAL